MALTVNTNTTALTALRYHSLNQRNTANSFAKISSGLRISKAADDAAGLAVAENLDATERSARVARRNIHDGISVIQTYEGAVNEISNLYKRGRELAVQASSETLTDSERALVQLEYEQLVEYTFTADSEALRIAETTNFNGIDLLTKDVDVPEDGISHWKTKLNVQAGVNNTSDDRIEIALLNFHAIAVMGHYVTQKNADVAAGIVDEDDVHGIIDLANVETADDARKSIYALDLLGNYANKARTRAGAVQNRLESALNNIENYSENLKSSESQIRDADFAHETAVLAKYQIMTQASTSVLAQANQVNQSGLRLLG